jgi:hypothetical protein
MVTTARQAELDQLINDHFMYEATDNLDGVMDTFADNIRHEGVPSPVGELTAKADIRDYYTDLFGKLRGESVTPLSRYYGDDFVVDETLWSGHITDGSPVLCDGKSGDVSFRLLHVFEVKDGKIAREQVWLDLAAIQQQLGCVVS